MKFSLPIALLFFTLQAGAVPYSTVADATGVIPAAPRKPAQIQAVPPRPTEIRQASAVNPATLKPTQSALWLRSATACAKLATSRTEA